MAMNNAATVWLLRELTRAIWECENKDPQWTLRRIRAFTDLFQHSGLGTVTEDKIDEIDNRVRAYEDTPEFEKRDRYR